MEDVPINTITARVYLRDPDEFDLDAVPKTAICEALLKVDGVHMLKIGRVVSDGDDITFVSNNVVYCAHNVQHLRYFIHKQNS